jgi:hypothetical protein
MTTPTSSELAKMIDAARETVRGGKPTLSNEDWEIIFIAARNSIDAAALFDARATELLEANNRLLERARESERREAEMQDAMRAAAKVIASFVMLGGTPRS